MRKERIFFKVPHVLVPWLCPSSRKILAPPLPIKEAYAAPYRNVLVVAGCVCVCAIRGVSVADNVDAHVDVVSDDGDQEDDLQLDLTLGVLSRRQSRSQDFTLRGGGHRSCEGALFSQKS